LLHPGAAHGHQLAGEIEAIVAMAQRAPQRRPKKPGGPHSIKVSRRRAADEPVLSHAKPPNKGKMLAGPSPDSAFAIDAEPGQPLAET
jgi:hypothetical protein